MNKLLNLFNAIFRYLSNYLYLCLFGTYVFIIVVSQYGHVWSLSLVFLVYLMSLRYISRFIILLDLLYYNIQKLVGYIILEYRIYLIVAFLGFYFVTFLLNLSRPETIMFIHKLHEILQHLMPSFNGANSAITVAYIPVVQLTEEGEIVLFFKPCCFGVVEVVIAVGAAALATAGVITCVGVENEDGKPKIVTGTLTYKTFRDLLLLSGVLLTFSGLYSYMPDPASRINLSSPIGNPGAIVLSQPVSKDIIKYVGVFSTLVAIDVTKNLPTTLVCNLLLPKYEILCKMLADYTNALNEQNLALLNPYVANARSLENIEILRNYDVICLKDGTQAAEDIFIRWQIGIHDEFAELKPYYEALAETKRFRAALTDILTLNKQEAITELRNNNPRLADICTKLELLKVQYDETFIMLSQEIDVRNEQIIRQVLYYFHIQEKINNPNISFSFPTPVHINASNQEVNSIEIKTAEEYLAIARVMKRCCIHLLTPVNERPALEAIVKINEFNGNLQAYLRYLYNRPSLYD